MKICIYVSVDTAESGFWGEFWPWRTEVFSIFKIIEYFTF